MSKWDGKTHEQRFHERYIIDPNTGCWVWTAGKNGRGYAYISVNNRTVQAYRWYWQVVNGPVPEGLELDHVCRNRACVRPDHLEPVTRRENQLRGINTFAAINAAKTHCPKGHPYDEANTQINSAGSRCCRTCERARVANMNAKRKEARRAV